jgi:hypothetical protein
MFELIGLILRLPFYLMGLVAVSILWMPLAVLITIFITIWGFVYLPFVFVSAAFRNDRKHFEDYVEELPRVIPGVMRTIPDAYRGLYNWLVGQSGDG